MGLREDKKRAVRARLYETACELFADHGYDGVSVADITAAAGVAKGTFFNHFPTKAHILYDWYAELFDAPEPGEDQPFDSAIKAFFLNALKKAARNPELFAAKHDSEASNPVLLKAEREADERARRIVGEMLRAAKTRGEIGRDVVIEDAAALSVTVVTGAVREWRFSEGADDLRKVVRARLDALCALLRRDRSSA